MFAREAGHVRLFVSTRSGGPLDDDDIVRIFAKAANRAGIRKHVTPHTLRHTCATHLLKGRADIRQIQVLNAGIAAHGALVTVNTLGNIFRGNAASSTEPQHGYEIVDRNGDVKKVGVSGQSLYQNGTSPRANPQVNQANKGRPFGDWLKAQIKKLDVGTRREALEWEKKQAQMRREQGHSMEMLNRP